MVRIVFLLILTALAVSTASSGVQAADTETIAIIGTGPVGAVLGPRFAAMGHKVIYGSRTPDADKVKALVKESPKSSAALPAAAARSATIVVVAVPGRVAKDVVLGLGNLKGKVIIDTNNLFSSKDGRLVDPDTKESIIEQIQAAAPDAFAVKAFNTVTAVVMKNPAQTGGPVTIPIVGNDPAAKAKVTALAKGLGFEVVDLGTLEMARFTEQLGRLYVMYGQVHKPQRLEFNFHTWDQP